MRLWMGIILIIAVGGGFLCAHFVVAGELVNINTASLEELDALSGIGLSKAQAIVDYRTENGDFETIEDIMKVSGIGQVTFDKIKGLITVGSEGIKQTEEKIVINELLPNPNGSDNSEWIELKNIGESDINLTGWSISDAAKNYVVSQDDFSSTVIQAGGFFILDKGITKISLNNSGGETVSLYNPEGNLISQTNYSQSAKEDYSWARNDNGAYQWTTILSQGSDNIIFNPDGQQSGWQGGNGQDSAPQDGKPGKNKYSDYKNKIIISEFLANPVGIDDNEWIEIYNTSTVAVNLEGWLLKDNSGEYRFKKGYLAAKAYLVVSRAESGLILNNIGGDKLELIDRDKKLVDKVSYKKKAVEGESYNWCPNLDKWVWTKEISLSKENVCPLKNKKPVAYFEIEAGEIKTGDYVTLDASESYDRDRDGRIVKYRWVFNKEVMVQGKEDFVFEFKEPRFEVKFLKSGKQKVTLAAVDNLGGEDDYSLDVLVGGAAGIVSENVVITKFLPNPVGADSDGEWIELCNRGDDDIDLGGFSLDDAEGGSAPFKLDDYSLPGLNCLLVMRLESGIALNNDDDSVRFLNSHGDVIDEVSYGDASEGAVYARSDKGWQWIEQTVDGTIDENSQIFLKVNSLRELREFKSGTKVRVRGWVAVEPGLFGKTIFYIIDKGSGVQVYFYKKDFPDLTMGDFVEIFGELGDYQGEMRIKIKNKGDIIKTKGETMPEPQAIQIEDIGEESEGALVKIRGELTEKKSSSWWLDDKTDEIKIYIKRNTGIKSKGFEIGDRLEIIGIVSQYKDEYRILPRWPDDVKLIGRIAGGKTVSREQLNNKKGNGDFVKYLLVAAVAIILILLSIIIRFKK